MNSKADATQLALKIVKAHYPEMPADYRGRRYQIALAAIIETTEAAAKMAETLFDKGGCHAMYKNAGHQVAAAIRTDLKAPQP